MQYQPSERDDDHHGQRHAAYENTPEAHKALRREEELWACGEPFAWAHLHGAGKAVSNNYWGVQATMAADNWRSFRGWGITAMLPWDQQGLFRRVRQTELASDWNEWAVDGKRPGLVACPRTTWGDPRDWAPTALGETFRRWNLPDCAWIGGDGNFTDKRHVFRPGETVRKTLVCAEVKGAYPTRIRELPPELNGLSNGDWSWHGSMDFAAFTDDVRDGNAAFRVVRYGKGRLVFWQVPPWKIDDMNRPYLRISKRRAEAMLSRLMGNLGFNLPPTPHFYADVPVETDDPYRYYHW